MTKVGKILKWLNTCLLIEDWTDSVITGSSVHNQRIERLWRDMFRVVGFTFYKLFHGLEALNLLDPLNPQHLFALHYVYLPQINSTLESFCNGWNQYCLSSEKSKSPLQLFVEGISKLHSNGKIAEDFFETVGENYGIDIDGLYQQKTLKAQS